MSMDWVVPQAANDGGPNDTKENCIEAALVGIADIDVRIAELKARIAVLDAEIETLKSQGV